MARSTIPSWRRLPIGVELDPDRGAHARVWAPKRKTVEFVDEQGRATALTAERDGYFSAAIDGASAGTRYRFRVDGKDAFPDPASRFQPDGPHGPSEIVDPTTFRWTDAGWKGAMIE